MMATADEMMLVMTVAVLMKAIRSFRSSGGQPAWLTRPPGSPSQAGSLTSSLAALPNRQFTKISTYTEHQKIFLVLPAAVF
jgi:hypothetical protein